MPTGAAPVCRARKLVQGDGAFASARLSLRVPLSGRMSL